MFLQSENIDIEKSVTKSKVTFYELFIKQDYEAMEKDLQRTIQAAFFFGWIYTGFSKN